jgi:hypothetical protein
MKIVSYISMIISLGRKFMPMRSLVVVCGCESLLIKGSRVFLHPNLPAVSISFIHGVCFTYKYASDLIWRLGKNNLDNLGDLPVASDTGKSSACNFGLQPKRKPSGFGFEKRLIFVSYIVWMIGFRVGSSTCKKGLRRR